MEVFEKFMRCKIHQYKFDVREKHIVPVYDGENQVAELVPVGINYKHDIPNCIGMLNKWREENPTGAFAYFKMTAERTEKWFAEIMFFVKDSSNKFIGHFGYRIGDCGKKEAEIRGVIRGEKSTPRIMEHSFKALINWGRELGLEDIWLMLYADNAHAVQFYERCGLEQDVKVPYKKIQVDDEIKCVECGAGEENVGWFLKMKVKGL